MKKTYLAWIFTGNDYFQSIVPHFFLLKKLSENFRKLYLINLVNLKLFDDVRSVSSKLEMSEKDKKFFTFGSNVPPVHTCFDMVVGFNTHTHMFQDARRL